MARRLTDKAYGSLSRFCHNGSGGVAVIFALASVPILMAAGMAIDYAANSNARQEVQNAVDATALSLAKLPLETTDKDLSDKADKQVKLALSKSVIDNLAVTMNHDGDFIQVGLTGTTPTTLTRLMGHTSLPLQVTGTAKRSTTNLEIALVLDNTGSMKGAKLTNLKAAANDLVDKLHKQSDPTKPGSLKIGIVPFSMTVNLGTGVAGSAYLDLSAKSSIHKGIFNDTGPESNRFSLFTKMNRTWAGCVESRPAPYDVQDTAPSEVTPDTLFVPFFAPDESDEDSNAYNNYMSDEAPGEKVGKNATHRFRQGLIAKYGKNSFASYTSTMRAPSGYQYGPNAGCEIQPITRLTTSQSVAKDAITAMTIIGDTNIPMGLVWGWHVLSPFAPFRDGTAYDNLKTKKFIVLMTDGQNTSFVANSDNRSIYSGLGYYWQSRLGTVSNDAAVRSRAMDDRLTLLCTNIKRSNIQIFTVRVEVTDGTSDVLRNCATNSNMFFDVKDSSGLPAVFKAIAEQISDLRIAK